MAATDEKPATAIREAPVALWSSTRRDDHVVHLARGFLDIILGLRELAVRFGP
jgi:hypothetical protein